MELLEKVIKQIFPHRTVETIKPQNTRPGNEVGFVTFADGESFFIKTAVDTNQRLAREIAATRYAEATCPIEVPNVLDASPDGSPPYLAMTPLPGTPLNDPWTDGEDREVLLREAGRTIAGVHNVEFDTPGRIVGGDSTGLELTDETWTETLCKTIEWRAEDWFADRFEDIPERLVEVLRDAAPLLDDVDATLLHGDCSRINIHLHPNGLLDWERALVGDPAFDLVDTYGHLIDQVDVEESERDPLKNALYEGYRERAGDLPSGLAEREPLYQAVAYLLVPQTFEDWSANVDRPNNELAEDIRAEFDSRLDKARQSNS